MSIISPFEGGRFRVTSAIGVRSVPSLGIYNQLHFGLDIVGESSKNVTAVAAGVVGRSTMIPKSSGDATWQWGNYIRIDGDDGFYYYYCHLSKRLVSVGQRVRVGDVIGVEGATGQVTGPHLHLEKRRGTQKCAVPARDNDSCNIAAHIGIPNAVGVYTAQVPPAKRESDEDYIRLIVEKVGYDTPAAAIQALKNLQHPFKIDFLRKLWEELKQ